MQPTDGGIRENTARRWAPDPKRGRPCTAAQPVPTRPLCLECVSRICHHFDVPAAKPVHLGAQEMRLLRLLALALSNKEIAAELGLSAGTVKVYMSAIFRKLGLTSRLEAAMWAIAHKEAIQ